MPPDQRKMLRDPVRITEDRFLRETIFRRLIFPRRLPPVIVRARGVHDTCLMPARPLAYGVISSAEPIALVRHAGQEDNSSMQKASKKIVRPRTHESREDRARTLAGKTANSKVRSEGRALAAQERSAESKRAYAAATAKKRR